jgi:hypothetical protein
MSNITSGFPTLNTTYFISESSLPSTSSNSTFVNEYIAYVDDDVHVNYNITTNTINAPINAPIYAPILNEHPGFTGTHGPYILSGLSGYSGYNNFYYSSSELQANSNFLHTVPKYIYGPYCNDTIIKNIKHVGSRNIPINSTDIITYEEINEGDILIDFNRDSNKTEYDYNVFYKESTLIEILKSKKNQFTMKDIDISSIVKYSAIII